MKYKAGDRVRIKSIDWYNKNKDEFGVISCDLQRFTPNMSWYCKKILTISCIIESKGRYEMLDTYYYWTDEMIEGLAEEEVGLVDKLSSRWVNEFNLPDGYIFKDENGNVINAKKIVLEKKKKEYPKTYVECCKIIGIKLGDCYIQGYKSPLLEDLQELLICRNAYWKLYGEEMGLGKPWEPDWTDLDQLKYCIWVDVGEFITMTNVRGQHILVFPTEEMRDAFYENFKELIESVKELL